MNGMIRRLDTVRDSLSNARAVFDQLQGHAEDDRGRRRAAGAGESPEGRLRGASSRVSRPRSPPPRPASIGCRGGNAAARRTWRPNRRAGSTSISGSTSSSARSRSADMWSRARSLWRAVRHRSSFERGMDDELRFHLEARAAHLVKGGHSPADAARQRAAGVRQSRRVAGALPRRAPPAPARRASRRRAVRAPRAAAPSLLSAIGRPDADARYRHRAAACSRSFPPSSYGRRSRAIRRRSSACTPPTRDPRAARDHSRRQARKMLALRDGLQTIRALAECGPMSAWLGDDDGAASRLLLVTCNFLRCLRSRAGCAGTAAPGA